MAKVARPHLLAGRVAVQSILFAIPAQAGIQQNGLHSTRKRPKSILPYWIPAYPGMTGSEGNRAFSLKPRNLS